jgi:2-amino-4-hydroxy-6-hydroxymethyldihydropteridine diphosphokinase
MPEILIALGSNLGERLGAMCRSLAELAGCIHWQALSPVYETAPMYVTDQPAFFNAAARGETRLGPLELLDRLKRTERAVGRAEAGRFGPREIDLDLIAYGRLEIRSDRGGRELVLPHPRAPERRFVLAPLHDIAPDGLLPGLGRIDELLEATNSQAKDVRMVNDAVLSVCRDGRPG